MPPAGLFRRPDEVAVFEGLEVVGQRHPGIRGPRQDHPRGPRRGIDAQQVQRLLVARLALDIEGAAVGGPVHPRQIDVGVGAQIDLRPLARVPVMHIQFDHGIGPSGARIALLDHTGPATGDVEPRNDVDGALVGALQGDPALVGAPPIAGVAVHLFLGDELGGGPGDQALAVGRHSRLVIAVQVQHDQVLVTDEGDEIAFGRDLGVDLIGRGFGQAAHRPARAFREEDIAFQRRKDVAALLVPGVFDHATLADPHPLAPGLLGLGQFARVGHQRAGVDQLERLALTGRRGPQVQHIDVVFPRAQEGHQLTIRRQADTPRHRPGQ